MHNELIPYLKSDQVTTALIKKGLSQAESNNYISSALRVIASNDKLANCNPKSVLDCLALCAELKLSPESSLGYLYFIPYGNTCTPMIGARGMKSLLLRDKAVTKLSIHIIKEHDQFEYWEDSERGIHYKFKPAPFAKEDSEILGAIAYLEVQTTSGKRQHLVRMSKAEIDKIQASSRSKDIWNKHYEEMAKKTVMRRLYKEVPTSFNDSTIEASIALEDDNDIKEVKDAHISGQHMGDSNSTDNNVFVDKTDKPTLVEELESQIFEV